MEKYHSINTVWMREPAGKRTLMWGRWTLPELEFLKDCEWEWSEKIHGTNVRAIWEPYRPEGERLHFKGRTEKSQLPLPLAKKLAELITPEKMLAVFGPEDFDGICLYGEGMGYKIQKVGHRYIADDVGFILFDVKVGELWLERHNVEGVANRLGIPIVPIIGKGTLMQGIGHVLQGFTSQVAEDKTLPAEGLVMKPTIGLLDRQGNRIIAKVKGKDFAYDTPARVAVQEGT